MTLIRASVETLAAFPAPQSGVAFFTTRYEGWGKTGGRGLERDGRFAIEELEKGRKVRNGGAVTSLPSQAETRPRGFDKVKRNSWTV